jgi:purine-nucleoside/S-methyl-5'-thioadenosine phosphorylase / adenosine deaminase
MSSPATTIQPQWRGPPRVRAVFTTRAAGLMAPVGAKAGLRAGEIALDGGDIGQHPVRDRDPSDRRVHHALPGDPVWLTQVHGTAVTLIDSANVANFVAHPPQADAAVTHTPDIVLAIRTADCLPVLLADRAGSVLAVAHAGWRGLAAGVLDATLAAMPVPRAEVVAWFGPSIGPAAFEVGRDVYDAYCTADAGASACFVRQRADRGAEKWLADLGALARRRLLALGVREVSADPGCTFTDADRFYSHRRDHGPGRMALLAWLAGT